MNTIIIGDCVANLRTLATLGFKAQMCVTSPPYFGLRDYGHPGQIGLEASPDEYVTRMVEVFRGVRDVLSDDGTLWLNIGDTYAGGGGGNYSKGTRNNSGQNVTNVRNRPDWLASAGLKAKDLLGIPWMLAFALRADGWYLRQDIIWHKPNPMPESVRDRCTKAHEYMFLLSKSERYYFDSNAMKEQVTQAGKRILLGKKSFAKGQALGAGVAPSGNGLVDFYDVPEYRNRRSVWTIATKPYAGAHFAVFPPSLIEPCILAGSRPGDIVLDPFMGSGTTAMVAKQNSRQYLGCELNPAYEPLWRARLEAA